MVNERDSGMLTQVQKREQNARRKNSSYRKWMGDDIYSYSLFVGGREVYSGMSRTEARWRRDRYVAEGVL